MTTNVIILGIVVLLILLLLILLILLINLQKNNAKSSAPSKENATLINITALSLPKGIEKIPAKELSSGIPIKIFRVFESLDYKKNIREFNKAQWHSWQVGILLSMYKQQMDFHIGQPSNVFPKEIVAIDDKGLRQIVNDIMVKYRRDVAIKRSKDFLCKDTIWSGREVAVLFYFLSKYKSFPRGIR